MTAITKQKMGTHAGITYSVQITKIEGLYYPRIVILSEPNVILDACIIFDLVSQFIPTPFKENPFNFVNDWAVAYIDGITDPVGALRLKSGEIEKETGVQYLEKKLSKNREILAEYKKNRASLQQISEDYKIEIYNAAQRAKWLQRLISIHYMSERYAGRISTEY